MRGGQPGSGCRIVCSFNPTLVRLRVERWEKAYKGIRSFNPTLVRLRGLHGHGNLLSLYSFNPTLVRLRGELV
ncbi:MAG: hypothetical protein NZ572_08260 [Thermoflexus sp.]|nr:hypothetical protein [Thermoflexus sp.]